jgi:hypothetical protein
MTPAIAPDEPKAAPPTAAARDPASPDPPPPPPPGAGWLGTHRALRVLLYTALVVTAAFLVLVWQSTFAPAIALVAIYCLLVLVSVVIHRARRSTRARRAAATEAAPTGAVVRPPQPPSGREVLLAEEKVGLRVGLEILGGLLVLSVLLASILLEWRLVAIGSLVIFGLLTFLGGPFWLAIIVEQVEAERERLTGEKRSNQ